MKETKIAFIPNADWYCALRCAEKEVLATLAKKTGATMVEFHRETVECECKQHCPIDNTRQVAHVVLSNPALTRKDIKARFVPQGFVICPMWAWEEEA